ncbi:hypothetical protein CEF21_11995 [Bacillus sp. FJAT-42376]|uniref:hypothetical protein n=1 Tax=Bacillus sp. FJAT-42376 TaxID=2014076 RepID=UPI000F4EBEF5|nr:hypothetical protein [Bacillus sp. FJAT-42376]AZB42963.1 hypothetical protein CEF21_11995 [Bacillus sp. FJAT-42376]
MSAVFIFTSILLHIVSLYLILLLFMRISSLKQAKMEQQSILEETEQLLAAFMLEQRDEHERFLAALEKTSPSPRKEHWEPVADQQSLKNDPRDEEPLPVHLEHAAEVEDSIIWNAEQKESREEVVILHEKGYSIEEIARETGKGKTEVELLLKFRQK